APAPRQRIDRREDHPMTATRERSAAKPSGTEEAMLRHLFTRTAFTALVTLLLATPPRAGHAGGSGCAGDCDGSGQVTVDEITTLVNITLGNAPTSACANGASGTVDIAFIIRAVGYALTSCPVTDCNDFRSTCSFDLSKIPPA